MVLYNPKEWWRLIFAFQKSEAFRLMTPGIIAVAIYTGIVAYLENDVFHASFKNTTAIHSLVGFVLSLLLVFRTNTAYERWWDGRKLWGSVTNDSRAFAIKINALLKDKNDKKVFEILILNYSVALKNHLRGNNNCDEFEYFGKYNKDYYDKIQHLPNKVVSDVFVEVDTLYCNNKINGEQLLFLKDEIQNMIQTVGACERIKNTPIPYSYNMFIKKVIFLYVFTMPIGFVREFGYWAMPIVSALFYVFASIELIAEEIEDPFGEDSNDLPLEQICQNIKKNLAEIFYN
jgi:ion channel-forming bestrophin family protein